MKRELIETGDGSHSLYVPDLDEQYHSRHGALQESRHVFLEMGWKPVVARLAPAAPVRILEIGFGTGLNALLTLAEAGAREVWYTTVEAYPLSEAEAASLNFPALTGGPTDKTIFAALHAATWESWEIIQASFHLYKMEARIEDFALAAPVDLIYFDAFAPNKQPELWTVEVFVRMYEMLRPGGRLTTYCAKGDVRRALQAAGFQVSKCPGPPGKREMLVADKSL